MMTNKSFEAAIFDMDGVITQTASLHAKAWKTMFDDFLKEYQQQEFEPFDIKTDYKKYVDGKPRLDGIRSFLKSRDISVKEGSKDDTGDGKTVYGLGNKKNEIFLKILDQKGVHAYPDALHLIKKWKGTKKLAVISASKNCRFILDAAGVLGEFEVRVDGMVSEEKQLKGKPEPDIFLEACDQLGVEADRCIVFEDALAGVEAGRKGRFGLVIGVARDGEEEELLKSGADFVVSSLENIEQKIKNHA